jgi:hypothetical protein
MVQSILSRLEPARIALEPFPYVHAPEALDPAYYNELAEAFPSMERIAGSTQLASNRAYRMLASRALGDPGTPAIRRGNSSWARVNCRKFRKFGDPPAARLGGEAERLGSRRRSGLW